jgi:putative transposase
MEYISFSSRRGRHLLHICFKVKYCHRIFDDQTVQKRCEEIFRQVEAQENKFILEEIGFDRNHVHFLVELGPQASESYFCKKLKGTSGKFLLREFPYLKHKHFWGSGLWNPGYFCVSVGDSTSESTRDYVKNQGLPRGQTKISKFFN